MMSVKCLPGGLSKRPTRHWTMMAGVMFIMHLLSAGDDSEDCGVGQLGKTNDAQNALAGALATQLAYGHAVLCHAHSA